MAKLRPLWTPGGGGRGGGRPSSAPVLVSPRPANAVHFFEDFFAAGIGTLAYVDSAAATSYYGHPNWVVTGLNAGAPSNNGTAGCGGATGLLGLFTGAANNDTIIADAGGRTTLSAATLGSSATLPWNLCVRFGFGTTRTSQRAGFAMCGPIAAPVGTDWVTDPVLTFNLVGAGIVIWRDTAGSGDVLFYMWDGTGTLLSGPDTLIASASLSGNPNKYEVAYDGAGAAGTVKVYVDGVLAKSFAAANFSASLRPSWGIRNLSASGRVLVVDLIYHEQGQTTPR